VIATADWEALGCAVRLAVVDPRDLETARAILVEELAAIDLACSRFRPDSELSKLGRGSGRPVAISPLFAGAVAAALHAAEVTDGDVDPTLGSAMDAVGYDRDFVRVAPNGGALTVVARPAPGWRRVELDRSALTLTVPAGVRLDLGATAKAYAADLSAKRLDVALQGRGALVSLGGDVAVAGDPPEGGWSIRVQDVTGPADQHAAGPTQTIALRSGGLATSSTAARRWVRGGQVLHHILDPRNGVPVSSPWRTVTAASATCLEANIATTAGIVRGEAALEWFSRRNLAGRFVYHDGAVRTTGQWPAQSQAA
jgi:thiamine biosynthesis lipoprotein ApbE